MSDQITDKKTERLPRREFLKGAAFFTGVTAVGAVGDAPASAAAVEEKPSTGAGYRQTDHVRTYYSLARF